MSMNPEQDNFDDLRRLLAIKRHEQPPPRYFHAFSRQVIGRIQAEQALARLSLFDRLLAPFRHFTEGFEAKPLVAGAFGVGICSLLILGLVSSERMDANGVPFSTDTQPNKTILATMPNQTIGSSLFERAVAEHLPTGEVVNIQGRSSIFDEIQRPHVQTVNFSSSVTGN